MKKLLIALVTVFAMFTTFAQKEKGNKVKLNHGVVTEYSCPMHHNMTSNKPSKCPVCNMELTLSKKEQMKSDVVKKTYTCPMHHSVSSDLPGKCKLCNSELVLSPKEKMKMQIMKLYTCPMHGAISSKNPGKCPKCGMELTEAK